MNLNVVISGSGQNKKKVVIREIFLFTSVNTVLYLI